MARNTSPWSSGDQIAHGSDETTRSALVCPISARMVDSSCAYRCSMRAPGNRCRSPSASGALGSSATNGPSGRAARISAVIGPVPAPSSTTT
jgi:hypothetical protein